MIAVDGRKCWTLFDSGARNTYVTPSVAELLKTSTTPRVIHTALGGGIKLGDLSFMVNRNDAIQSRIANRGKFGIAPGGLGTVRGN